MSDGLKNADGWEADEVTPLYENPLRRRSAYVRTQPMSEGRSWRSDQTAQIRRVSLGGSRFIALPLCSQLEAPG